MYNKKIFSLSIFTTDLVCNRLSKRIDVVFMTSRNFAIIRVEQPTTPKNRK